MSGLMYKNFRVNLSSFIFSLVTAAVCCLTLTLLCVFGGEGMTADEETANETSLIFAAVYYLAYMLPAMATSTLFQSDESRVCTSFAMSLPQGAKGHVMSKYYYLLAVNIAIMFVLFVNDTVCTAMLGGRYSGTLILTMLFCWRLLLMSVEIPFIIRFGSQRGLNIKGAVIGFIFVLVMIYFLFGDISWLIDSDDPIKALIDWLQSGDILFLAGLIPYFSVAAYYLSYRISVNVYRKGAESYEQ